MKALKPKMKAAKKQTYSLKDLEGRKIVMTEIIPGEDFGDSPIPVLVLDNGLYVIVMRDAEGNGGGFLKVTKPDPEPEPSPEQL